MATNELIEKLKEIIVHVGLAGEYKPGYDIVRNLRETKCKECIRLADELDVLESQAKEPSDEDIENESKTSLSIDCRGIELPKEIRDLNLEILQKGL